MRRFHEGRVGAIVGYAPDTVRATILQHLASSSECSGARCVRHYHFR